MEQRRILCLDVGDRRIGIAISDALGLTAQPLETYRSVGYGPDARHIAEIARQREAALVLLGLPKNMDGSEGAQAGKVRAFAEKLQEAGLQVAFWDERLSTRSAHAALIEGGMRREKRKSVVDQVAAVLILQGYLDAGGHNHTAQTEQSDK